MRIIINIDALREGKKRLRIRTRYNLTSRDGKNHLNVANSLVDFYNNMVETISEGADHDVTDFVDEGEQP